MADIPPPPPPAIPSALQQPLVDSVVDGYRQRLDQLWDDKNHDAGSRKVIFAIAGVVAAALTSLGGYLWSQFVSLDLKLKTAQERVQSAPIGTPVGAIVAWPVEPPPRDSTKAPQPGEWHYHWHVCNGERLPTAGHETLALALGAAYARADSGGNLPGPGEIQLPNLQGYFLRGLDPTGKIDPDGTNRKPGQEQGDDVGKHEHIIRSHHGAAVASNHGTPGATALSILGDLRALDQRTPEERSLTRWTSTGGPEGPKFAEETRPRNYAIHWVIRIR